MNRRDVSENVPYASEPGHCQVSIRENSPAHSRRSEFTRYDPAGMLNQSDCKLGCPRTDDLRPAKEDVETVLGLRDVIFHPQTDRRRDAPHRYLLCPSPMFGRA